VYVSGRLVRAQYPQADRVRSVPVRSLCLYAAEEGWPFVGMAPELLNWQFGVDHLFDKHGGPFVINAGFLGGRAVCFRDVDAILEASLQKADVLEITLQGAGSCSAIFTTHPCCLSSK
jgi:hypothetical protein